MMLSVTSLSSLRGSSLMGQSTEGASGGPSMSSPDPRAGGTDRTAPAISAQSGHEKGLTSSQTSSANSSESDATMPSAALVPSGASSHDRSPPMVPWTDPPRQRPDMHEQLSHSVWSTPSPSQMEDVCSLQPPPFETPSGKLQRLMAMRNAAHTKWESPSPGISRGPAPGP